MSEALDNIKRAIDAMPPESYSRVRPLDVVAVARSLKTPTRRSPDLLFGAANALKEIEHKGPDAADILTVFQTTGHLAEMVAAAEGG